MIPATMRALQLRAYDGCLHLVQKPVPQPGPGQVLIKVAASPVNPSDLKFIVGGYGIKKPLPVVPGLEGSGTVIVAGPGLMGKLSVGKRVGCMASETLDGTWAEYMVTEARRAIPLNKAVTLEQGATMVVNPWTAWALLDTARRAGHRAAVHTVAASQLGRMLLRLGQRENFPIIHIVRRAEQVELLNRMGATLVLNSSDPDFDARLKESCQMHAATVAFDPVAGAITGRVLAAMPEGSTAIVYGSLSDEAVTVRPEQFIYEGKRVEGFWLSKWVARKGLLGRAKMAFGLQKRLATDFQTEIRARVTLEDAAEAIEGYKREMTGGKVLIMPGGV